jgi:hypothetical protein
LKWRARCNDLAERRMAALKWPEQCSRTAHTNYFSAALFRAISPCPAPLIEIVK